MTDEQWIKAFRVYNSRGSSRQNVAGGSAFELYTPLLRAAKASRDPVENFLYYATFTHFSQLRTLLCRMLNSNDDEVQRTAAKQITLAAFRHPEAREDVRLVISSNDARRQAAAEIYSLNVHYESIRGECISHLEQFFNDPEKRVRELAADWFRGRAGDWPDWQRKLLTSFIKSKAFEDGSLECTMSFERTLGPLPPEFLLVAQRAVELFEEYIKTNPPYSFSFTYKLPALAFRFYEQSKGEAAKVACLDLLDRMLALGWGEAANELVKVDRS